MGRLLTLLCGVALLVGCSSTSVDHYANNTPVFDVKTFFEGDLVAHGVLKNRSGEVTRYFSADLEGTWESGVGTLEEWFVFDDGEKQERIWTLTPNEHGGYTATAGDVVGSGQLKTSGNALFMKYVLQVPYNDGTIDVSVDDRMYLIEPSVVINESVLTKFGFEVGYLTLTIRKLED